MLNELDELPSILPITFYVRLSKSENPYAY